MPGVGARYKCRPWTRWPNAVPKDSAAAPAVGRSAWINHHVFRLQVALRERRQLLRGDSCFFNRSTFTYQASPDMASSMLTTTELQLLFIQRFVPETAGNGVRSLWCSASGPVAVREKDQDENQKNLYSPVGSTGTHHCTPRGLQARDSSQERNALKPPNRLSRLAATTKTSSDVYLIYAETGSFSLHHTRAGTLQSSRWKWQSPTSAT